MMGTPGILRMRRFRSCAATSAQHTTRLQQQERHKAVAGCAARLVARGDDKASVLRAAVNQAIVRVSAKEVSKNRL
jgi:hypothetical protein